MSQRLDLVIKASDKVNPDNQKKAAPIEIRVYELKNDAAFTAADWWSLQDNDKAVLADDLLHCYSSTVRPAEEKKLRRPLNKENAHMPGILAGYRTLGKIRLLAHRGTAIPRKKLVQPLYAEEKSGTGCRREQSAIVIKERDD